MHKKIRIHFMCVIIIPLKMLRHDRSRPFSHIPTFSIIKSNLKLSWDATKHSIHAAPQHSRTTCICIIDPRPMLLLHPPLPKFLISLFYRFNRNWLLLWSQISSTEPCREKCAYSKFILTVTEVLTFTVKTLPKNDIPRYTICCIAKK